MRVYFKFAQFTNILTLINASRQREWGREVVEINYYVRIISYFLILG